jgi:hypothetical protein
MTRAESHARHLEWQRLYTAEGRTLRDIGAAHGVSAPAVFKALVKLDQPRRPVGRRPRQPINPPAGVGTERAA